jgi:methyl-accepting chemotaxis protein
VTSSKNVPEADPAPTSDADAEGREARHRLREADSLLAAIDRSQAVIEFDLEGRILRANENLLQVVGYREAEVVGQHHRMFCLPGHAESPEYAEFWERLRAGEFEAGEFPRQAKDGRTIWLQASYNPILDADGRPQRIVKFASDITAAKTLSVEHAGRIAAVDRSQAVIEFDLAGRVLTANHNFLQTMGYELAEVQGRHHRMFCDPDYVATSEYADFWDHLGAGNFASGEYKRRTKDGRDVWLQATYNPILDATGRPQKIVKFASDVTDAKAHNAEFVGKVAAIDRAQAVIEFDLSGHVLAANQNFLACVGYSLQEVQGKHHRMFCEPEYVATEAYTSFWERLGAGEFDSGEFRRVGKGGRELWLQATYNPILDADGTPVKIVKFATDITQQKLAGAEISGKLDAVDRAQAVIEFDLDGHVLQANENFQRTMGYSAREIVGQHHSLFCTEDYVRSEEYRDFWLRLGKGEVITGRFQRVGKFGREVHIQAAYNPVFDLSGAVLKVVKFAYDVTDQVVREQRIAEHTRQMTASVRDLSGSIERIAASSTTATDLARETGSNADQGVEALRAALEAIALIERSSSSIGEIVRVMGEIANQTNLLAFNASIEAARAGEHGVGFSIVAGEVRKLAERSSEAAQEIARLIEESAERVDQGAQVSKRAEAAFERIVESVEKTNDAITEISEATRLQQDASGQVDALIAALAGQQG